jgi:outer membrane protein assembly factor BamB
MKRRIVILLLPFVLASCDKLEQMGIIKADKKVLTKGERETVLMSDDVTVPAVAKEAGPVVLPAAVNLKDWPQAGQNATHALPHIEASPQLKPLWEEKLGVKASTRQRLLCEPIIAEGLLFIYTPDSYVNAYDIENGERKWSIFIKPEQVQDAILGGGAAYNNGKLYISTPFAELFAIDIKEGKPLWSAKTNSPLRSAPTIADGRVYVVSLNNELNAYDEATGKLLWTHAGVAESAGLLGGCTPSVHQGVVIAPYSSGEIFALQAENGYPLWNDNLSSPHRTDSFAGMPHIRARPVIQDGVAYVVSQSGRTAAFDVPTGNVNWAHEFGGSQTPLVVGDSVYIITGDNHLICLEKTKGQVRWSKKLAKWEDETKNKGRINWNGPIVAGHNLLMTGSHGILMAVSALDGTRIFEFKVPGQVVVPPIAANGTVFVVTESGSLVAFR